MKLSCSSDQPTPTSSTSSISVSYGDEYLVHAECIYCKSCQYKINVFDEYYFDNKSHLLCKQCTIKSQKQLQLDHHNEQSDCHVNNKTLKRKKFKTTSERLSTRQKELIKKKFLTINCDLIELKNYYLDTIKDFADEIDCSEKSVINYIDKRLAKRIVNDKNCEAIINVGITTSTIGTTSSGSESNESCQTNNKNYLTHKNEDTILDQLTKLDKTIAPNQNPFVNCVTSKKSINTITITSAIEKEKIELNTFNFY